MGGDLNGAVASPDDQCAIGGLGPFLMDATKSSSLGCLIKLKTGRRLLSSDIH
jgi:hypothetical protein